MKSSVVTGLLLVCLDLVFAEEAVNYDRYKVYQITPRTEEDAIFINNYKYNEYFDFWSRPRFLNASIAVMVAPVAQQAFERDLNLQQIDQSVLIENVERTIREERLRQITFRSVTRGEVSFTEFMRYDDIKAYLEALAESYPDIARIEIIGKSYEGRDLIGLRISSGGANKPTIFIDAGIHAREWIAPSTVLYIIHQLAENPGNAALYQNVDWVVVPTINPDGYEFTHTETRLWRKTRTPNSQCYGVDANRNFDYYWMLNGASDQQCSDIYAGPTPFSENETSALRDYLLAHRGEIKLYLTFHSYGQYILYPWGYTDALPVDHTELHTLGELVNTAIQAVSGTAYTVGTSTNVLYAAAGGSDDYAKGVAGIQLSYTIELPGGGSSGFDPVGTRILPIAQETWEGVKAYQRYIEEKFVN